MASAVSVRSPIGGGLSAADITSKSSAKSVDSFLNGRTGREEEKRVCVVNNGGATRRSSAFSASAARRWMSFQTHVGLRQNESGEKNVAGKVQLLRRRIHATPRAQANDGRITEADFTDMEDTLGVFSKFIDDQLLQIVHSPNVETPVRQALGMASQIIENISLWSKKGRSQKVPSHADGTDTRPYRLIWPSPSVIFSASPKRAFNATSIKQIEKGMKVPRSCLLQHLPLDFVQEEWGDDFVDSLLRRGYRGDAPSAWVIEIPRTELSEVSLQEIFTLASSLLMKGSTFLGVISCPWMGTSELEIGVSLGRLCAGHGFTVKLLSYEKLTSNSHSEGVSLTCPPNMPVVFIAEQLRLSDAQVEYAQEQIEMAEEVDEEGFEDSW